SAQLDQQTSLGHNLNLNLQKQRGSLIGGIGYLEESDTYDPNDLGFNYNNNRRVFEANIAYRDFTPKWDRLMKWSINANVFQAYLYEPNAFSSNMATLNFFTVSKKFNACGFNGGGSLSTVEEVYKRVKTFLNPEPGVKYLQHRSLSS
ncbi:MAG: hypothetical protein RJB25_854, partial [Bacteroidota bacterium]